MRGRYLKDTQHGSQVVTTLVLPYDQQKLVREVVVVVQNARNQLAGAGFDSPEEILDLLTRLEHDAKALADPAGLLLEQREA